MPDLVPPAQNKGDAPSRSGSRKVVQRKASLEVRLRAAKIQQASFVLIGIHGKIIHKWQLYNSIVSES